MVQTCMKGSSDLFIPKVNDCQFHICIDGCTQPLGMELL